MSHDLYKPAAETTPRFRRPVGTIAVLALAAGLSGCGAAHESGSATQTPEATITPTSVDPYYPETSDLFDQTSYDAWGGSYW